MAPIADFDHNDFELDAQNKADESLLVKFFIESVKNARKSLQHSRPIFEEKEYISITVPGSRDNISRPASDRDKQRFPRHYAAFKQRIELPIEGTPLTEWPMINRSLADELAFRNLKTVEQLANLNDSNMAGLNGAQGLKQKAKKWLETTKDDTILAKLQDELSERDAKLATQAEQIASMLESIEALQAADKPKRRKRRTKQELAASAASESSVVEINPNPE